jgi:hypothetical protein
MANRQQKEENIAAFADQRWNVLMIAFRNSRDAQIARDPAEFSEIHQKHYDELLDKILELAERR